MTHSYSTKSLFAALGLCVIISIAGCSKQNNNPKAANNSTNNTATHNTNVAPVNVSPFFLKASLAGEAINVQGAATYFTDSTVTTSTQGCEGHQGQPAGSTGDPDSHSSTVMNGGKWLVTDGTGAAVTTGVVEIEKLAVRVYVAPIAANHYDMVAPGVYGFASSSTSGAYVAVLDANGTVWTTKGDQTGSVFEITARGANTGTSTTFAGTFTAKMYDNKGNVKQVTNATFNAMAGL